MPAKKTITKSTHVAKRIVVDENGKERILHGFGWGKKTRITSTSLLAETPATSVILSEAPKGRSRRTCCWFDSRQRLRVPNPKARTPDTRNNPGWPIHRTARGPRRTFFVRWGVASSCDE